MSAIESSAHATKRRWSPPRVAAGLMLAAWAGMFWFLIFSSRELLYVSTRTRWVVPTGAIILTGAALGRLLSARTERPEPLVRKEAWVIGFMVIPVITVLVLPPTALGTYAASRRSSFVGSGIASSGDLSTGSLTLIDLASTPTTELSAQQLAKRAGEQVEFIGLASTYDDTPADEFYLTRFIVTCCVADATVAQVRVVDVTPGSVTDGDWVKLKGTFYPVGSEMLVAADSVEKVPQPGNPYLTP